jgi:GNAT superfamily N-acetyltransferase
MPTSADIAALDREMGLWLDTDPETLRVPGVRHVEWAAPEVDGWLGYNKSFFALAPVTAAPSLTVASTSEGLAVVQGLGLETASDDDIERIAAAISGLFVDDDCYSFDILCGSVVGMNLTLDADRVREDEPANAIRWDGVRLDEEVDGAVFSTSDERGMTAWAGIKCRQGPAWDLQVGTRDDQRGRGLGRVVTSHAIERLQSQGITPYYAHLRNNSASAALARSLGFEPYAVAVLAEHRDNESSSRSDQH